MDAQRDHLIRDMQAQQLDMMTHIRDLQHHQQDYASKEEESFSTMFDEMAELQVHVANL